MTKRDNPDIRYTFLSKQDLQKIDRGEMTEPCWTGTKEVLLKGLAADTVSNEYLIKNDKKKYVCICGFNKATQNWKTFMIYDKTSCVQKGNLYTVMDFLNIDSTDNYYNVENIEEKPELFLKIYKDRLTAKEIEDYSPQKLAYYVLDKALSGCEWAKKCLAKPQNPIKIICKREGMTRPQLAKQIGVKLTLLENCISRETCSQQLIETLRKYYNYI